MTPRLQQAVKVPDLMALFALMAECVETGIAAASGAERRFSIGFARGNIGQRMIASGAWKSSFIARSKPVGNRRSVLVVAWPRWGWKVFGLIYFDLV